MTARRAHLIALLAAVVYLAIQLATLRAAPLTDDDDFYVPAGISYAGWLGRVARGEVKLTDRGAIDAAFEPNHEHPPLAKYVFGLAHAAFAKRLGPTDGARVGATLFSTLAAWLLMFLAITHLGPGRGLRVGLWSALALATLPRFFFHSHAATLDVPVAAMYLLAATAFLRGERSTAWALAAGVAFGLATATKLNAPFLVLPVLGFVGMTRGVLVRSPITRAEAPSSGLRLPSIPLSVLSMAIIGPLTFFASWPWMWFETVARVKAYVGFHLHHYPIFFLYLGRVYSSEPFAPWHAPFVTAGLVVPTTTLVLAAVGVFAAWPAIRLRLRFLDGPDDDHRRAGDLWLFVLLNALTTIGLVAFAGTPIYGGEKLFMPFFPFLCLLAGLGASTLYERLADELAWSAPKPRAAAPVLSMRPTPAGGAATTDSASAAPALQDPLDALDPVAIVEATAAEASALVRVAMTDAAEAWSELVSEPRPRLRAAFAIGVTALVGAGAAIQLKFADVPLSSWNGVADGLRGATALGMERQYYDLAYRDLVAHLSKVAPQGLRVHFLPNNWEYIRTYKWYREAGELRPDITVTQDEGSAEWVVITHERRFARYGEDLARYRGAKVLLEKRVDGVPLWTLVERRAR